MNAMDKGIDALMRILLPTQNRRIDGQDARAQIFGHQLEMAVCQGSPGQWTAVIEHQAIDLIQHHGDGAEVGQIQ